MGGVFGYFLQKSFPEHWISFFPGGFSLSWTFKEKKHYKGRTSVKEVLPVFLIILPMQVLVILQPVILKEPLPLS